MTFLSADHLFSPASSSMAKPSQRTNDMFGQITSRVRTKGAQKWASRIDLDGLSRFLREQHPDKTAAHVEALTGVPYASVRKWLSGDAAPNARAMAALILTYGPELLHAMVIGAPDWLKATVRERAMRELEQRIADQQAALAEMRGER